MNRAPVAIARPAEADQLRRGKLRNRRGDRGLLQVHRLQRDTRRWPVAEGRSGFVRPLEALPEVFRSPRTQFFQKIHDMPHPADLRTPQEESLDVSVSLFRDVPPVPSKT